MVDYSIPPKDNDVVIVKTKRWHDYRIKRYKEIEEKILLYVDDSNMSVFNIDEIQEIRSVVKIIKDIK